MADQTVTKPPFWSSLPGILTGVGAVIMATTGLITALYSTGVIGSKGGSDRAQVAAVNASPATTAPAANSGETERYRQLVGKWEVIQTISQDSGTRITWNYDASVSGNVLTLNGKMLAIGADKNLSAEEERMSSTFVITLHGPTGLGEHRAKGPDGAA